MAHWGLLRYGVGRGEKKKNEMSRACGKEEWCIQGFDRESCLEETT
jgi:hypothetical protein